jgi:hypothetical protein
VLRAAGGGGLALVDVRHDHVGAAPLLDGSQVVWSLLALLSLAIGTAATARELGRMGPYLKEHWAVAQGKQPTQSFEVTLRDEGRVVLFSGGINDGAAAAIDKAIGAAPRVGTVLLHSPGGWLREGRRMAEVVKRYQLNTRVEGECFLGLHPGAARRRQPLGGRACADRLSPRSFDRRIGRRADRAGRARGVRALPQRRAEGPSSSSASSARRTTTSGSRRARNCCARTC